MEIAGACRQLASGARSLAPTSPFSPLTKRKYRLDAFREGGADIAEASGAAHTRADQLRLGLRCELGGCDSSPLWAQPVGGTEERRRKRRRMLSSPGLASGPSLRKDSRNNTLHLDSYHLHNHGDSDFRCRSRPLDSSSDVDPLPQPTSSSRADQGGEKSGDISNAVTLPARPGPAFSPIHEAHCHEARACDGPAASCSPPSLRADNGCRPPAASERPEALAAALPTQRCPVPSAELGGLAAPRRQVWRVLAECAGRRAENTPAGLGAGSTSPGASSGSGENDCKVPRSRTQASVGAGGACADRKQASEPGGLAPPEEDPSLLPGREAPTCELPRAAQEAAAPEDTTLPGGSGRPRVSPEASHGPLGVQNCEVEVLPLARDAPPGGLPVAEPGLGALPACSAGQQGGLEDARLPDEPRKVARGGGDTWWADLSSAVVGPPEALLPSTLAAFLRALDAPPGTNETEAAGRRAAVGVAALSLAVERAATAAAGQRRALEEQMAAQDCSAVRGGPSPVRCQSKSGAGSPNLFGPETVLSGTAPSKMRHPGSSQGSADSVHELLQSMEGLERAKRLAKLQVEELRMATTRAEASWLLNVIEKTSRLESVARVVLTLERSLRATPDLPSPLG